MNKILPHQNLSIEDIEGEIWKDIEEYDGYYQISNFGRVKSLSRTIFNGKGYYLKKEKIMKLYNNNGYKMVNLYVENIKNYFLIHRLVALSFIDNPLNKQDVKHLNSNKKDNSLNNLEWVTTLESLCFSESKKTNNTSKYIGVSLNKKSKKKIWKSQIAINKKNIYLGSYYTEEEAYKVRCEYEKNNNIKNKYL